LKFQKKNFLKLECPEQHTEVVIKTVTQSKNTPKSDAFEFVGMISNINIWKSVKETNNVIHNVTFSLESTGQQNAAIANFLRFYAEIYVEKKTRKLEISK